MRNDDQEQRRPDYQNYYPYQNYYNPDGRPKKKKHTGLLVILVTLALITGGLVVWKHRGNIQRLLAGTESKFSLHRKH